MIVNLSDLLVQLGWSTPGTRADAEPAAAARMAQAPPASSS